MRAKFLYLFCMCCLPDLFHTATAQQAVHATDTATRAKPVVQQHTQVVRTRKPKQINTEFSGGIRLNTDGWSLFGDYGKSKVVDSKHADRFYHVRFYQFELTEKKSQREMKSSSGSISASGNSDSYVFGKINNFYALKLGLGFRKMIAGKPESQGTVSVHWVNTGGISIGFLKPYYLNIQGISQAVKYTDNNSEFLDPGMILSSAGFSKGLSEAKVIPGVHFKSGFHFDFAGSMKYILAFETGVNAEYYSQQIQLMASTSATPYFVDVYMSFQFGKRW